jgi:hypothetical protein
VLRQRFGNAHAESSSGETMPSHLNSTGQQALGDDITGASDAIVMASAPDVALPMETETSADVSTTLRPEPSHPQFRRPWPAIVSAGALGLLFGIVLKKSFR